MGAIQSCYSFHNILSPSERSQRTALVNGLVLLVPVSPQHTEHSAACNMWLLLLIVRPDQGQDSAQVSLEGCRLLSFHGPAYS